MENIKTMFLDNGNMQFFAQLKWLFDRQKWRLKFDLYEWNKILQLHVSFC